MVNTSAIVAGVAFVTLAATNVVVMLEASQPSRNASDEKPLDRCSPVAWVLVCDSALHHGLQHESETCGVGISGHLPTHLVLHIVLVLVLVPLLFLKILIARRYKHSHSSLKALGIAIFIISFALVSIPTLSELLRSASPGSLGLRLGTGLIVTVCLVQCALVFKKRKQPRASVESSSIPEISCAGNPINPTAKTRRTQ